MTMWTSDQLSRIGAAGEVEVAPLRGDGTAQRPVVVWVVRHGDGLFVRSWLGTGGIWFRRARRNRRGRLRAGGESIDVGFVEVDATLDDDVDAAYRRKYAGAGSHLDQMVSRRARATTLQLVPRADS
jgi:hypothetical protein